MEQNTGVWNFPSFSILTQVTGNLLFCFLSPQWSPMEENTSGSGKMSHSIWCLWKISIPSPPNREVHIFCFSMMFCLWKFWIFHSQWNRTHQESGKMSCSVHTGLWKFVTSSTPESKCHLPCRWLNLLLCVEKAHETWDSALQQHTQWTSRQVFSQKSTFNRLKSLGNCPPSQDSRVPTFVLIFSMAFRHFQWEPWERKALFSCVHVCVKKIHVCHVCRLIWSQPWPQQGTKSCPASHSRTLCPGKESAWLTVFKPIQLKSNEHRISYG